MKVNENDVSQASVLIKLLIDKGLFTLEEFNDTRKKIAEDLTTQINLELLEKQPNKDTKILNFVDFKKE